MQTHFFEASVNDIGFLIFISACLLLAYGKAVDICVFILYTAPSLKESTAFMCLLVQSTGFYMFSITSSATKDRLVFVSGLFPSLVLDL